jgi:cob(I)alamin adenosyltransferase
LALYCNLLNTKEVLDFLDKVPSKTDVVLTGRYAPKEITDRAEFVNEIIDVKSPKTMVTTKGMQY